MRFIAKQPAQPEQIKALIDSGISPVAAQLLAQRGLTDAASAQRFLHPDESWLHDPMAMHDMEKAVLRIRRAMASSERMVVYGDYDADGVTAVSVLLGYFAGCGVRADYYIPARHEEGYGLNEHAVRELAGTHTLLISVDCGIASHQEVLLAQSLGMDVIVTDHHQLKETLPPALAVLNPLIGDYPCPFLCGAGVALKLVHALGGLDAALEQIDLAAIGTVADIVPLLDENRAIAALGIAKMNRSRRVGIDALCQVAHLGDKPIDSGHIGFLLGPRINAGGRIDRSGRTVELMLTDDRALAQEVAAQLESHNLHRQQLEREITAACEEKIPKEIDFQNDRAIILWGEDWNVGVVGIVASRMTEKYTMPCILLSRSGDTLTGSGRSVRGVHLLNAIGACAQTLTRFGGHEMAAGVTLCLDRFEQFRAQFNQYLRDTADPQCFVPAAFYDAVLKPKQATLSLFRELEQLMPFGMGNPTPQFLISQARLGALRTMGQDGRHVRAMLEQDGAQVECVGFSMADQLPALRAPCDLLVQLGQNQWGGRARAQVILRRVKPADQAFFEQIRTCGDEIMRDFFAGILYNTIDDVSAQPQAAPWQETAFGRGDLALVLDVCNTAAPCLDTLEHFLGAPSEDPRAFPALVAAPRLNQALGPYRRFIFCDGFDARVARAILHHCPDAQFFTMDTGLARRPVLPDVEALRRVYAVLRGKAGTLNICADALAAARKAAQCAGVSPLGVLCALMIFHELGFMRVSFSPWMLTLCPDAPRRELSQSGLYRYLTALGQSDG